MFILMREIACGANGNFYPGSVYSTDDSISSEMARAFVDGGFAVEVDQNGNPIAVGPAVEQIATTETAAIGSGEAPGGEVATSKRGVKR